MQNCTTTNDNTALGSDLYCIEAFEDLLLQSQYCSNTKPAMSKLGVKPSLSNGHFPPTPPNSHTNTVLNISSRLCFCLLNPRFYGLHSADHHNKMLYVGSNVDSLLHSPRANFSSLHWRYLLHSGRPLHLQESHQHECNF